MHSNSSPLTHSHSFIVRVWWEPGLTRPDGRPLWRGQVQHAASGQSLVFQSLDELSRFIQRRTGLLDEEEKKEEKEKEV